MLTDENFADLKVKGYTVVSDVLTEAECDETISDYRKWLSQFKNGEWPISVYSLIQRYNTGNMHPSWFVRLKSKKVFAQVWGTEKLLSSIDAIAIGRPPEDGEEQFYMPGNHWLHLDQCATRQGLHAYQGAVYLEAADEDDWTLHVLEGSHLHFSDFYENNTRAYTRSVVNNFYRLLDEEVKQMQNKGCILKRVPVPKGGMVLWDSRLVHANASPIKGRKNPGRWRFCVFVSMTPAIWATEEDMEKKNKAYENAHMTTHWSSQGVMFFKPTKSVPSHIENTLPSIAKTKEAKLIAGTLRYDFDNGEPNGDSYIPKWKEEGVQIPKWKERGVKRRHTFELDKGKLVYGLLSLALVVGGLSILILRVQKKF